MRLNPLSLMGGAYADNSLTWSAQRTLNWLPETAEVEGTRTPIKFADAPGLRAVVDLGTNAPIRGIENVEGTLFVVSGTSLFEIALDYTATNRGNIPGVGRVSMAHNKQGGTDAANQLAIANGLSGYVYNTSTNVLAQITDESFEGASTVDYIDGFITFTDPQGRFWGHSALNQAGEYSTIDRYDAESAPDPIVSHIASHREAIVFGTRTTEFFRNTGAATNTFQRVDGTELEVGICSTFARARVDNSVCWVSDSLEVFRLEGHSPQRISTRPIEQLLHTVNPANIFAFSWEDRGHKVFYITAPEAFTIGFDFASGMWHERQSFNLPRWRVNALASWNNQWIAGDYTNGLLYVLDWDTHHEIGQEIVRERASGYTHGGQNKVLAPYVELLFDTGVAEPDSGPDLSIVGDHPNGEVGVDPGTTQYVVSGGMLPYTFSISSGSLPTGRILNTSTGEVTGTPTAGGTFSWTVTVTDIVGDTASVADGAQIAAYAVFVSPTTTASSILRSDDSITYTTSIDTGLAAGVNRMYTANGRVFVFPSSGTTARVTADRGAVWNDATGFSGNSRNGMTYSEHLGVGRYLAFMSSGADAFSSTDGLSFSSVSVEPRTYYASASIGSTVVAMSTVASLIRSTDGGQTFGAAFSNGVGTVELCIATSANFIAAGANGLILRSPTGITWTQVNAGANWQGLAQGNGRVMVLGIGGECLYSDDDGATWTAGPTIPSFGTGGGATQNLSYGNGLFIAVGGTQDIYTTPSTGVPVWTQRKNEVNPPDFEDVVAVRYVP